VDAIVQLDNLTTNQEFDGYIIKLKEEPLVEKYIEIESDIGDDGVITTQSKNILNVFLPRCSELATGSNEGDLKQCKVDDVGEEHEEFKQEALQELGKESITNRITGNVVAEQNSNELLLLNEFQNVFNGVALNITDEEAQQLKQLNEVEEVYPNYIFYPLLMDSLPLTNADDVWQLDRNENNCIQTGEECLTGKGITIGIIDSGVDYTHPDLGGCFGTGCKVVDGHNFLIDSYSINGSAPSYAGTIDAIDVMGHGTHVAATAAGNGVLKGVAPDANIVSYKVLDNFGNNAAGLGSDIIAAIDRSVDPNQDNNFSDHLDIISLSLGINCRAPYHDGCGPNDPGSKALDNAVAKGVVAVVAAANSGPSLGTIGSPSAARNAITVGATYKKDYEKTFKFSSEDNPLRQDINPREDQIVFFSSRGPVEIINEENVIIETIQKPDIVAPGAVICAAEVSGGFRLRIPRGIEFCVDEKHIEISGTSMSAPHVSGAAALILQAHPDWTPAQVKEALMETAIDLGLDINTQGAGRLDVLGAVLYSGFDNLSEETPIIEEPVNETPIIEEPTNETPIEISVNGTIVAGTNFIMPSPDGTCSSCGVGFNGQWSCQSVICPS
tara:strand:- start:487 stop:2322 length:1836 start_codon:yes stop_codon:yes gene_type:complete